MTDLVAAAAGAAIVAGLMCITAGFRRVPPRTGPSPWARLRTWLLPTLATSRDTTGTGAGGVDRARVGWSTVWSRWRWPIAAAVGVVAWLVTAWPVAAAIAVLVVIGVPVLLSTPAVAAAGIDRIEAVEEWTRRLADVLVTGVGLEQAITATAATCPARLQREVGALVARLQARWDVETALRAFAADLDDATADLVVATLILGARRRGPGLARVLAAVADSVAAEVAMRRGVEAERARPRATARAVTLITLAVIAFGALNTTYTRPYGTPTGQLALAVITAGFAGALWWMRAMTLPARGFRLLDDPLTPTDPDTQSGAETREVSRS
ncbi:MAG: type II secretion system F family protein [Actinomycetales bacterium]|nr:type II secretion system F family protein [Actinomycetales bacterium]